MAVVAGFHRAVDAQHFLDGGGVIDFLARGVGKRWHFGGWRRHFIAKDRLAQPDGAVNRMGRGAGAVADEHRSLGGQATERCVRREGNGAEFQPLHALDPVVGGERFVEPREIGIDDVEHTGVAADQFADEADGFIDHVIADGRAEQLLLAESLAVRHGEKKAREELAVDVDRLRFLDAEPLGREVPDEVPGAVVGEHAARLSFDHGGVIEFFSGGQGEQFIVREAAPEEIGEPRGQLVAGRGQSVSGHGMVEKLWRGEHHGQRFAHGFLKRIERRLKHLVDFEEPLPLVLAGRAAEGSRDESFQNATDVFIGICGAQRRLGEDAGMVGGRPDIDHGSLELNRSYHSSGHGVLPRGVEVIDAVVVKLAVIEQVLRIDVSLRRQRAFCSHHPDLDRVVLDAAAKLEISHVIDRVAQIHHSDGCVIPRTKVTAQMTSHHDAERHLLEARGQDGGGLDADPVFAGFRP